MEPNPGIHRRRIGNNNQMTDNKPLYSNVHKKISDKWDFKVPYIGKYGNLFLDWIWLRFHRVKLTESNFEKIDLLDKK